MPNVPPFVYAAGVGIVLSASVMYQLGAPNSDAVYVAQSVVYSNSTVNGNRQTYPRGDHSNSYGGTAPGYLKQAPVIPTPEPVSPWLRSGSAPSFDNLEAKFRTHCNYSHLAYDDPILFPGQPGRSHLHMFFGNTGTNAYSTYYSLRTTGQSTCMGGYLNRTAYWFPAVLKDDAIGDGKTMAVKPDNFVIYYSTGATAVTKQTSIPRGFNYITGFNPADPTSSREKAEIAAATGTFAFIDNGFQGWRCEGADQGGSTHVPGHTVYQPYLKNDDGTATLDCASGTRIYATVTAAPCWDGVNLSSPDGRSHIRDYVQDSAGDGIQTCPVGWYRLPRLSITFWFSHLGMDDYKNWYLSSDRFNGATFKNGQSFHTDWFGAWDPEVFKLWQTLCNGAFMPGESTSPHTCSDSQIGDGRALWTGVLGQPSPNNFKTDQAITPPGSSYVDTGGRWTNRGNSRFLALPGQ